MVASDNKNQRRRRRQRRYHTRRIAAVLIFTSSLTVFNILRPPPTPSFNINKHDIGIPPIEDNQSVRFDRGLNSSQSPLFTTGDVILDDDKTPFATSSIPGTNKTGDTEIIVATKQHSTISNTSTVDGKIFLQEDDTFKKTTSYSYDTMDVKEFKRLHRNYLLLRQQQQQNISYLSSTTTLARERDSNGNLATTYAFTPRHNFGFGAGFRNQIMALTMLVMHANDDGHDQILLDSLWHKDTYGTNQFDPFDFYFDVETWNRYSGIGNNGGDGDNKKEKEKEQMMTSGASLVDWSSYSRGENKTNPPRHPNRLPRIVLYNQTLHDQWDLNRSRNLDRDIVSTRPYGYTKGSTRLAAGYQFYVKGKGRYTVNDDPKQKNSNEIHRNPAEILMLQGALKPHPALQAIVDRSKIHLQERASRVGALRYMTLHARIEPDMQRHPVCKEKKVLTLQEIVNMVEFKWPDQAPVDVVFLPINRQYIEREGTIPENYKNESSADGHGTINWIAADNLRVLNRLTNHNKTGKDIITGGMWNGTVPVIEFGSEALQGTVYDQRPSTSGSILNYFLSLDADIFVGTEVSSFSHDVLSARFYRGLANGKESNSTNSYADKLETKSDTSGIDIHTVSVDAFASARMNDNMRYVRKNNFKYLPGGRLQEWITEKMVSPPGFLC